MIETELNIFLPKLALFLVLPILVIDLIIHSSSQETTWNSACITIFLNSHILLILFQWYWPFLPFSSLSFHLSFESHLSFLDDINSSLTHLPVFSLLSLHSLHSQRTILFQKSLCHSPAKNSSAPQSCFYPPKSFLKIFMEKNNCLMHSPELSTYLHLLYVKCFLCVALTYALAHSISCFYFPHSMWINFV